MKIYLAGPDIFRKNAKAYSKFLKNICNNYGHESLCPLDNEVDLQNPNASKIIFDANFKMIKECDAVLANMEPFRGPSIDVGTAWEIGAAKALGKKIILYNSTNILYKDKTTGCERFPTVEDFGLEDNLMIIHGADFMVNILGEALDKLSI